jgi:hypothetical protein
MSHRFDGYLDTIGMPAPFRQRVSDICAFYETLLSERLPGGIEDVFVSEYVKEDGTREYESVWLFAGSYRMEAHGFTLKDNFDVAFCPAGTSYMRIEKESYDFSQAQPQSRMSVEVTFASPVDALRGRLRASGANCDHLRVVLAKHLVPGAHSLRGLEGEGASNSHARPSA